MTKQDILVEFEAWAKSMPRAELGGLIKEYIAESNHSSWEGYPRRDLTGVRAFLKDVMEYHKNGEICGANFATRITTTNPVP